MQTMYWSSIVAGRCICPIGQKLIENNCTLSFRPFIQRRFPFRNFTSQGGGREGGKPILVTKPVIYLYPEKIMDISVQLNIKNSEFTTIYPKFNEKNTWNVRAKPNGDILLKDKTYPYLFWEADSYNPQETNEGFIVTGENAEQFLEEKLTILGLNEKEKQILSLIGYQNY